MSSLYEGLLSAPHSIAMFLQLGLFYLFNKKYYRDRLTIGLLFFALMVVAFIAMSAVIDLVVLFALALAVLVRAVALKNKHHIRISIFSMIILFTVFGYFVYNIIFNFKI